MSKTSFLIFLMASLFLSACQTEPEYALFTEKDHYRLKGYQNLNPRHRLVLADKNEPGQRLFLCGKLTEGKRAVKNQSLRFFHADDVGKYNPSEPTNKNAPRLNGYVSTNDLGMFFIETILPGGGRGGDCHIYMTTQDDSPYLYEIHFTPLVSYFEKRHIENNDQQFLVDLKKRKDGVLVGFVEVGAKPY